VPQNPCLVCGVATDAGPRCPAHALPRQPDRRTTKDRGTTTQRGLGRSWQRVAKAAIARQPWCSDCGQPARPGDPLTGDHIVARVEGGRGDPDNVDVVHRSCNTKRENARRRRQRMEQGGGG
jgi:5-methylcytosine-specific restriction endonuclease McrA